MASQYTNLVRNRKCSLIPIVHGCVIIGAHAIDAKNSAGHHTNKSEALAPPSGSALISAKYEVLGV